ncbi:DUF3077 domain-containing protein [Pseudomonas mosselii]|uniref:DUF3077 domain-containing protein n=1 Tax=Pseudomonas mosselii TaxID=78327 RepID=UPI000D90A82D|nr:DUF3077 domain-containing protein [Pseudomonas mosselii]PYC13239.1 hypothetical protein DMX06_23420 [Pseudomonas mosselii]
MTTDDGKTPVTPGKTRFHQGEGKDAQPLFCIEPGIPCQHAREQASELMDYVRHLTLVGVMDEDPRMVWAAHYLSALAKALMDDAELGMAH